MGTPVTGDWLMMPLSGLSHCFEPSPVPDPESKDSRLAIFIRGGDAIAKIIYLACLNSLGARPAGLLVLG